MMPHRRKRGTRYFGKPRQPPGGCDDDHLTTKYNEMDNPTVSAADKSENKITINGVNKTDVSKTEVDKTKVNKTEVNKTNVNKTRANDETEEHETTDCLALLEEIVNKFQVENNTFLDIMKNILCVTNTQDTASKKIKYELINNMLVILSESNMQDLPFIQNKVKAISTTKHMYKLYVDDEAIKHINILGEGGFGIVYRGILEKDSRRQVVAVKTITDRSFSELLDREAWAMSQFEHENILKILAINKDSPEIVIELMQLGNILDALRERHFSVQNIERILTDVASGMEYLHGKSFLHRDLACRNILINENKRCKIGDFGSCVYVGDSNGVFEEKKYKHQGTNISPETLTSQLFTMEADVWSMGILIWHVFHLLTTEFDTKFGPSFIMDEIYIRAFQAGNVTLMRPILCSENLFSYCRDRLLCRKPKSRPNFTAIKRKLEEISDKKKY